jgi:hypothetical protein
MSGYQLNASIARKVDFEVIPISVLQPVLRRNYFALINILKKNSYLANQIIFFYYQTLVGNASFLNNNKSSAPVRVPWDSVYQNRTGKPLILSAMDQYQLYMWVTINNTQNMNTQSNFQFLLFSLGNYMTQLNSAQRTLNQKLNASFYYSLGTNIKTNQQLKNFIKKQWINVPTSPPSNNPEPSPPTVPSAPTITSITPANTILYVNFTAPSNTGGEPITDYEYSTDNGITWTSSGSTTSPITISGLTNGVTYQVVLRAINSIGDGDSSNTVSAIPNGTPTIQTFTTIGTTSWTAPALTTSVEYLVVGGGGGSGATHDGGGAGGGGGGMVLTGTISVIPGNVYSVVVGDGGAGGISYSSANPGPGGIRETDGNDGANSQFSTIISLGGGYGNKSRTNGLGTGGTIVTTPNVASTGGFGGSFNNGGGGGGGNSSNGNNGTTGSPYTGGTGGSGISSDINGVLRTYGVGGNGGTARTTDNAVAGVAFTGNGAKGPGTGFVSQRSGAKGGSGIVILKYFQ